ncbi:MAG: hypothetical protein JST55_11650 [Bacteroidetes bacterium]|nr:hypothetical protein [Bacteroidota bacterium]
MKKIICTLPLILLFLSLVTHNGCKQEDEVITPVVDENVDKESASAKNISMVIKFLTDANSFGWAEANNITPVTNFCPNLYNDSAQVPHVLDVVYSAFPGCAGMDGVRRSGKYTLSYTLNSAGDSLYSEISFNDFRIYKNNDLSDTVIRIIGGLKFSSKRVSGTSYRFHSSGEVFLQTLYTGNKDFVITSLEGTANLNSLSDVTDDTYTLYGTGNIDDSGNSASYGISIAASTPLLFNSTCKYPLTGTANFTKGGVTTGCDFSPNSGSCDAIVKFTRGSFSKTVDLSTTNF